MIQNGETALHRAALHEHVEVVKTLVDYGAAADIRNQALWIHNINFIVIYYVVLLDPPPTM